MGRMQRQPRVKVVGSTKRKIDQLIKSVNTDGVCDEELASKVRSICKDVGWVSLEKHLHRSKDVSDEQIDRLNGLRRLAAVI